MQNAIQKAVEGGYKIPTGFPLETHQADCVYLLDPLFWQCLGKTEGWKYIQTNRFKKLKILNEYKPIWQYEWHRFIDHLAEGKDAESFFDDELLK